MPGASQEEIKRAFRHKAKLSHPDLNPVPSANQEFIKVKRAFDYLTGASNLKYSGRSATHSYSFVRKKYYERPESFDWESYWKWQEKNRQSYQYVKKDLDFKTTLFGRIVFYFFHLLFLFAGLYIMVAPTLTIITDGIDPERNIPVTIFAVVCASFFGLLMTIVVFYSGLSTGVFRKA